MMPQDPPEFTDRQMKIIRMMVEQAMGFSPKLAPGRGADTELKKMLRQPFARDTLSQFVGSEQNTNALTRFLEGSSKSGVDRVMVNQPVERGFETIVNGGSGRLVADVDLAAPDTIHVKSPDAFDESALSHEISHTQGGGEYDAKEFALAMQLVRERREPSVEEKARFPVVRNLMAQIKARLER